MRKTRASRDGGSTPGAAPSTPGSDMKFRPRPICVDSPIHVFSNECFQHCRKKCLTCFGPPQSEDSPAPSPRRRSIPLATPLFRRIDTASSHHWRRPARLITYNEPTDEEYDSIIEYDLDSEDDEYIAQVNGSTTGSPRVRKRKKAATLSENAFEALINFFEKEFFKLRVQFPRQQSTLWTMVVGDQLSVPSTMESLCGEEKDDTACCVCSDGNFEENNLIVFCDGCNIAVHQLCYGITEVPDGPYLCSHCMSMEPAAQCVLCPEVGGALKPTSDGRWCHVVCALWMPETYFGSYELKEPVCGIENVQKRRWQMVCYLCGEKSGACIQCKEGNCLKSFHVMCARRRGLYVMPEAGARDTLFVAYCRQHSLTRRVEEHEREWEDSLLEKHARSIVNAAAALPLLARTPLHVIDGVYEYWLEKRARKGQSLLRRLQLRYEAERDELRESLIKEKKHLRPQDADMLAQLRSQLERVRVLVDLTWKRERRKQQILEYGAVLFDRYRERAMSGRGNDGEFSLRSYDVALDRTVEQQLALPFGSPRETVPRASTAEDDDATAPLVVASSSARPADWNGNASDREDGRAAASNVEQAGAVRGRRPHARPRKLRLDAVGSAVEPVSGPTRRSQRLASGSSTTTEDDDDATTPTLTHAGKKEPRSKSKPRNERNSPRPRTRSRTPSIGSWKEVIGRARGGRVEPLPAKTPPPALPRPRRSVTKSVDAGKSVPAASRSTPLEQHTSARTPRRSSRFGGGDPLPVPRDRTVVHRANGERAERGREKRSTVTRKHVNAPVDDEASVSMRRRRSGTRHVGDVPRRRTRQQSGNNFVLQMNGAHHHSDSVSDSIATHRKRRKVR